MRVKLTSSRAGFMEVFFSKMGVKNLRFKPAYNPYTEPSLEIFSWHEGLGKWVEIGNSGMFRPEMLETMGLPADVRVLGFGLSLERPTMIRCVHLSQPDPRRLLTLSSPSQLRHLQHPRPARPQGLSGLSCLRPTYPLTCLLYRCPWR